MKRLIGCVLLFLGASLYGCGGQGEDPETIVSEKPIEEWDDEEEDGGEWTVPDIDLSNFRHDPTEWGENVTGVKTKLDTKEQVIALTLDACGGPHGSQFDEELLAYLQEKEIPATLFVNERWIDENEDVFLSLANNPLFQIENHGSAHKPLSVNGRNAWNIEGTKSPEEVVKEITNNQQRIYQLTGRSTRLFRSGTAFYDEVAVEIANALGVEVVNYSVLGDAGATFTAEQVKAALLNAEPGAIVLMHMNQPASGTAAGVKAAIPLLIEKGYTFARLDEYDLT
ncbi:polysaccharide deacetylase family protein [Halalkalibacterium halodurans]|jgi:peptidoglycan/xylan/chitin deacetylase (PgdA/CDA1 family)|uniref:Polysaccharide deacetylase n=1 Tax=Halalkalibacterium halodurans TaxID=86665 RepID=A0A0M0KCN7_ALKHA|nr:polysaccharide deacetylase family protein [Halalkalibacterium halodurans]MED3648348.1 polysaccharide deacetylase family protein [Halalkalibacterium halodurans]MED4163498.1 polysaccharide deacetylase family protein [Halalkalibacterium halodurans]TES51858.1 polysaccharide deacetylase [Halalkalibacterium halodurans]TPE70310.1 polysaccharide deacetylase [Halalkalibacterium halodurans]